MQKATILCRISWLGHNRIVFGTFAPPFRGNSFIPPRVIDDVARWVGHAFSRGPEQNAGERYGMFQK